MRQFALNVTGYAGGLARGSMEGYQFVAVGFWWAVAPDRGQKKELWRAVKAYRQQRYSVRWSDATCT